MRRILVFGALAACHENTASTLDASPIRTTTEETIVTDAAVAPVAPAATLLDLDGGPPARERVTGGVLLCRSHAAWTPPAGFSVSKVGEGAAARKDDSLVAIVFVPHADDSYATSVARFATGSIAWDAPTMTKIDDWHAEQVVHGRAQNLVVVVRTLYAGVDPKTGKGRANGNEDTLFVAAAKTDAEADALASDAKKNTLTLVDHACECGYDCVPARSPR